MMARPIRIEFANACYHVTARGNERRPTFLSDDDRHLFLRTLREMVARFDIRLHVYCLMPNHYHLALTTPRANLSQAIGWLQTTYTIRFNRRHTRSGHLFQGRYKAILVDRDCYAQRLALYIHLNPVRPRDRTRPIPSARRRALERYRWSSHRMYAGYAASPDWLCDSWLAYWGDGRRAAQRDYRRAVVSCFDQPVTRPWSAVRHGLALGTDAFCAKVEGLIARKSGVEEQHLLRRQREQVRQTWLDSLCGSISDPQLEMWMRVRLGKEPVIDIARRFGYRDGSGVTKAVRRLEARAKRCSVLQAELEALKRRGDGFES